jgi:DNA-binding beta-propeller fold protein YncE
MVARASLTVGIVLAGQLASSGVLAPPLSQIGSFSLGPTHGAIDDLAFDFANQRLFVLESGAGQIAVVDLTTGSVIQTVTGLAKPSGLARDPEDDRLYVATGEGKLEALEGVPLKAGSGIAIGPDIGLLHYDPGSERIYFAFGSKKVAIVDTTHNKHWNDIRLNGRPGPIALEDDGTRLFVGAVGEARILVADRSDNKQTASWTTAGFADPVTLAIDASAGRLLAAFRNPASLAWFDLGDGTAKGSTPVCAEPGRLLADSDRGKIYLTCATGSVEIYGRDSSGGYAKQGSMETGPGATAALLSPTSGRLYLAVPASTGHEAEIRIYAPGS